MTHSKAYEHDISELNSASCTDIFNRINQK